MKPSVLLIDDEPSVIFGYRKFLEKAGYETSEAGTLAEGRAKVEARRYDAVLLDMKLPDGNGVDFVPDIRALYPDIAIVIITGAGDVPAAVDALKKGADNFLTKPVDMGELDVFLRKSVEVSGLRRGDMARKRLEKKRQPFFGKSPEAVSLLEYAQLAADNDSTVLIKGETGVGKGVLARWIHERSGRRDKPFVEVNCSSLRGDLLSSELFGHAKGSFTSAVSDREGLVEVADRGTLFLDEIGDMPLHLQVRLLRVLEEGQIFRVGSEEPIRVDVRIIASSLQDLGKSVREGLFREDLYYRLNILRIHLPPLRERVEDISYLAVHFMERAFAELGTQWQGPHPALSTAATGLLEGLPWRGNVRELRNVITRVATFLPHTARQVLPMHVIPHLEDDGKTPVHASDGDTVKSNGGVFIPDGTTMDEAKGILIQNALDRSQGNRTKAAKMLGIGLRTIRRKLNK
ncbi:hypothetical protein LCGC14_1451660 [marine sediment metagenome]|uniref:Sigma-54-dependent Fis family transcriptional regulator n=1 Tax=marine sediment metagenome TaxID=412755 RepID=A0A0F9MJH7_9ZZZZ